MIRSREKQQIKNFEQNRNQFHGTDIRACAYLSRIYVVKILNLNSVGTPVDLVSWGHFAHSKEYEIFSQRKDFYQIQVYFF